MRAVLFGFIAMTSFTLGCSKGPSTSEGSSTSTQPSGSARSAGLSPTGSAQDAAVVKRLEAQTQKDIANLAMAIAQFKQSFGVDYLPSRLDLSGGDPATVFYMSLLFPQAAPDSWRGAGKLEGDQCLVFFLGGVQKDGSCYGFSTNPRDPMAAPKAGEIRKARSSLSRRSG
jgi:hypothetical protein